MRTTSAMVNSIKPAAFYAYQQMLQNAADRLLTKTKCWENIMLVLASFHWLPVEFGIHYDIFHFIYQALRSPSTFLN